MDHRHWTRAEALRQPAFLSTLPALLSFPALGTAFWFHQVHFAAVKGWEHLSLVAVFPLGTAMFFASTVLFGVAIDRFGSTSLMPLYLVPLAAGFLILSVATSIHHAALGVMLMGLAGGGQATLPSACWAEFFGTRHVGAIKSVVAAIMVLGSALGPGITGVLIDRGITMPAQLQGYAAIIAAASLVMVIPMARARPRLARTAQIDI